MINSVQLKAIIGINVRYTDIQIADLVKNLNIVFEKYSINTVLRMSHFLAQVMHESCYFRYTKEIWGPKPTAQQLTYEGRKDLGNIYPGDGFRYRGRSWIEDTGRDVYTRLSKEFGQDFVNNPDLLSQMPWCALASGSFWNDKNLNILADTDNPVAITKKVNGGLIGLSDRLLILAVCKKVLTN